ncbi:TIGR02594 family protein [Sphingomonas sp. AAP5]|uniref:NlpC/P60 family protein n=1 Tax=Sphingomonas sp. AAP5 TaxID=1523415 RepID=UPI001056EA94|nr:TIGR02594 family protein [Sphingomonas sp. AAP5]QBM77274.1 TIGR02594 family protein [Sphingomonas sp. AAP5]
MTTNLLDVQEALQAKGFDPGPIDGVRGRKTIAAILAFQSATGLMPDGIVGRQTLAKLIPGTDPATLTLASTIPWLAEAHRLLGLKEDTGAGSNQQILQWARDLHIAYDDDDVPWCGLFVGHCVASQLPREPLVRNPLGARSYETFGKKVAPQPGAIMVFWRESEDSGKGHVGFYVGEDQVGDFLILGGNQGNAVSIIGKPRARFLAARWPITALPATGGPVLAQVPGVGNQVEV